MKAKKLRTSELINTIVSALLLLMAVIFLFNTYEFTLWIPLWLRIFSASILIIIYSIMLILYLDPKEQAKRKHNIYILIGMYLLIALGFFPMLFIILKPVPSEIVINLVLKLLIG